MFSGLVECQGVVLGRAPAAGGGASLVVSAELTELELGESISVSGCCLTLVASMGKQLGFELSAETLTRTSLGRIPLGAAVNLERSLGLGDKLGGHLVTGHVDAVIRVRALCELGDSVQVTLEHPAELARFIAAQGSVCLDGVSLTVNQVQSDGFLVTLIPHTRKLTTLGAIRPGSELNLEVDLIARYVARQLEERSL